MHKISELNMLIRTQVELPHGLKLPIEEFQEGWNFARSVDARRLHKRILKHKWNFIKTTVRLEKSGVGPTSQHAIAGALTLALRPINSHFNAVEIDHIQLIRYPWFFLARVTILPYCIQESASPPICNDAVSPAIRSRQMSLQSQTASLHPLFASAIAQLLV